MSNERDSVRIAHEAILLLLYAWNLCPVPGTDISRSLVAVGREFLFLIDFSFSKHFELTSRPAAVKSYARELAIRLPARLTLLVGVWARPQIFSQLEPLNKGTARSMRALCACHARQKEPTILAHCGQAHKNFYFAHYKQKPSSIPGREVFFYFIFHF